MRPGAGRQPSPCHRQTTNKDSCSGLIPKDNRHSRNRRINSAAGRRGNMWRLVRSVPRVARIRIVFIMAERMRPGVGRQPSPCHRQTTNKYSCSGLIPKDNRHSRNRRINSAVGRRGNMRRLVRSVPRVARIRIVFIITLALQGGLQVLMRASQAESRWTTYR
jgi:hypothetical protein